MKDKNLNKLQLIKESLQYFINNDKFTDDTCAADLLTYVNEVIQDNYDEN